jgi:hypothetical protein
MFSLDLNKKRKLETLANSKDEVCSLMLPAMLFIRKYVADVLFFKFIYFSVVVSVSPPANKQ